MRDDLTREMTRIKEENETIPNVHVRMTPAFCPVKEQKRNQKQPRLSTFT